MVIKDTTVVITGGTSGIGYELVKQLHFQCNVIVISSNKKKLHSLSKEFQGIVCYQVDLSKSFEIKNVADIIIKNHPAIDILINNAAVQYLPTYLCDDFKYNNISHEIAVNFTSVCELSYLLLPALLHDTDALILNINSGLALAPKKSAAIYCATKGALNIFSKSLQYQLENTNIKVAQAFLELVDTPMTHGRGKKKISSEDAAKKIIDGIHHDILENDFGKVKLLRLLLRLLPKTAHKIMKAY